ncbi:MAG: hypothetical protein LBE74_04305 [Treponema sp.]|jgi:hypothetical protein|nr:hypothetical protein [Treponema sp.]
MIKRLFSTILTILAVTTLFSCDQDHIFYKISQEVKPTDPRIMGGPTAIVQLGAKLYSTSRMGGTVHVYENDSWSRLPSPGGKILELATDNISLFVLIGEPMETTYIKKYDGTAWDEVVHGNFETIIGAGDETSGGRIFAATKTAVDAYDTGGLNGTMSPGALLMGAAYLNGVYYLAVAEKGIFTYDGVKFSPSAVSGSVGKNTVGVLTVGNEVVAVTRFGEILRGDSSGFTVALSAGSYLTGGMGLWEENGTNTLLLVGLQGYSISTVLGYREIVLEQGALPKKPSIFKPGLHSPSTVSNADKYDSTIGIHVVTDIAQAADSKILFAATTKNGLWSYRFRDGSDVWNAEE